MAHYVMSDIHGEMDRFDAMLEKIRFTERICGVVRCGSILTI